MRKRDRDTNKNLQNTKQQITKQQHLTTGGSVVLVEYHSRQSEPGASRDWGSTHPPHHPPPWQGLYFFFHILYWLFLLRHCVVYSVRLWCFLGISGIFCCNIVSFLCVYLRYLDSTHISHHPPPRRACNSCCLYFLCLLLLLIKKYFLFQNIFIFMRNLSSQICHHTLTPT